MLRPVAVASLALALAVSAIALPDARQEALGRIEFPTSQTGAAQAAFICGVLLLHSFEDQDSKDAFLEAQTRRLRDGVLGEAMTYNHPLWAEMSPQGAREALGRLGATREQRLAKAASDKERDWLRGGRRALRRGGQVGARHRLRGRDAPDVRQDPDDLEVKAFYALALLGYQPQRPRYRHLHARGGRRRGRRTGESAAPRGRALPDPRL